MLLPELRLELRRRPGSCSGVDELAGPPREHAVTVDHAVRHRHGPWTVLDIERPLVRFSLGLRPRKGLGQRPPFARAGWFVRPSPAFVRGPAPPPTPPREGAGPRREAVR